MVTAEPGYDLYACRLELDMTDFVSPSTRLLLTCPVSLPLW